MTKERTYKDESDVKAQIKKILDQYRWKWRMPPQNAFGGTGMSDFIGLRTGVFLAVEAKFGDNEITVNQENYLNEVLEEGGFGFVVYEATVETFAKWNELFDLATLHTSKGQPIPDKVGAELLECIRILTEPVALAPKRRANRSAKRRKKDNMKGVVIADNDDGTSP